MPNLNRKCLDCERTDLHGQWCCQMHYRQRLRAGTLPPPMTTLERFWSHVDKSGDCWLWTSTVRKGYGRFAVTTGQSVSVHRFAYEQIAPIPEGMTIDHLCRNTLCVNAEHMEPVSLLENIKRRPPTPNHPNKVKTHCPEGDPYDKFIYDSDGRLKSRRCSKCDRRMWAEAYRRKRLRKRGIAA